MKYIFLDEFAWIDLRKYIFDESGAKNLEAVLEKMRAKIIGKEWAFVLSAQHFSETYATGDAQKRIALGYIMGIFSRGFSILPFTKLKDYEIGCVLHDKLSYKFPEEVIKQDIMNTWGGSSYALFDELSPSKENEVGSSFYNQLKQNYLTDLCGLRLAFAMQESHCFSDDEKYNFGRLLNRAKKCDIESPFTSLEQFLLEMIKEYYTLQQQLTIFSSLMMGLETIEKPNNKSLLPLFRRLPTFYTNCALLYKNMKAQEPEHSFHKNDFVDMLYLSYMIPYCDVVVTEKKWVNMATQQLDLDKEFNTIIISSLSSLLDIQ